MEDNSLAVVNDALFRAISAGDDLPELTKEEEKETLDRANKLSIRFLRDALRAAGTKSMSFLVRAGQNSARVLLNYLHEKQLKNQTALRERLEQVLTSFLFMLKDNFTRYFDHDNPMPSPVWVPIKLNLLTAIGPGDKTVFAGMEPALAASVKETLEQLIEKHPLSFRQADYWTFVLDKIGARLPAAGDPTLRTLFTLIAYNFNSSLFIQYVITRYAEALPEEGNALEQWNHNLLHLNRVIEVPGYALHPLHVSCKKILAGVMETEIAACGFTREGARQMNARETISLSLSVPQIGVLLRAMCDTGMIATDNTRQLTKLFAGNFRSQRSGAISAESLNIKFYTLERAAVSMMESRLVQMLNQCKKYRNEAK
jgi:hypothetical protein